MAIRRRVLVAAAGFGFLATGGTSGCLPSPPEPAGSCVTVPESVLDCRAPAYTPNDLQPAGLVGYSCTGGARPDLDATFIEGVPRGLLCADRGALGDGGVGYCCTAAPVDCAYNPTIACSEPSYGYQCLGTNRPESLNPALDCSNGNVDDGLFDFCCSGKPLVQPCQQTDVLKCSKRMLGFLCKGDGHPLGENLGANKSRADFHRLTCATPAPAPNPEISQYCCYMPALPPKGASCVNHTAVPGCAPGRFGFACYGPDTPEEDYLVMDCPDPPMEGTSAEGYPATLYCCDFM